MLSNIFSKKQEVILYDKKSLEDDIKVIAGVIIGNLPEKASKVTKAELVEISNSFFKRIKVCETKHELEDVEEFNVSKDEKTRLFSVVNVEDVFIQYQKNILSIYFGDIALDDVVSQYLFKIYRFFLSKKGPDVIKRRITGKYIDSFYNDPFIRFKQVKLSADNKTIEPDFQKYNKIYKTKGIKEVKNILQNIFSDFIKDNIGNEVISDFKGNDILSFASLIEDFFPKINTEYVFDGKTAGTAKDKIDFTECISSRFFFVTEYAASSGGERVSNAIVWTNWSNIINRFGLNGKGNSKFCNVINKYKKPNLIKDIYIISDSDFSRIIPPLQSSHQKVIFWENPSIGDKEEIGSDSNSFDASELFEEFKNDVILEAIKMKVTDIHIKDQGGRGMINFRLDNKTIKTTKVISRDKLLRFYRILIEKAQLDNTGSFPLPQDGKLAGNDLIITDPVTQLVYNVEARINLGQGGDKMYIRLTGNSMTPVGQNKEQKIRTLKELGYMDSDIDEIYRITTVSPNGLILVTGATGQGKSTLLFTLLNDLLRERPEVHMLTIEDPVEMKINLFNVEQNELKDKSQYPTFIKAFLRQDPDWIMVGETRDKETLYYLKEAALTGHLCFSTFHANDTIATLNRLINLLATDVSQRKLAMIDILTFIKGVASQKLVPKLCDNCKIEEKPANILELLKRKGYGNEKIKEYMTKNAREGLKYYKTNPEGCHLCNNSGNKGRQVLVEILSFIDPEVAESMANDRKPVVKTLFDKGLLYVAKGTVDLNKLVGEV